MGKGTYIVKYRYKKKGEKWSNTQEYIIYTVKDLGNHEIYIQILNNMKQCAIGEEYEIIIESIYRCIVTNSSYPDKHIKVCKEKH